MEGMPKLERGASYSMPKRGKKSVALKDDDASKGEAAEEAEPDEADAEVGTAWVDEVHGTEKASERTRPARARAPAHTARCGAQPSTLPPPPPRAAVFGLFAALGNASSKGGNSMNRNPLPRGRAVENVDWVSELYKYLPPTSGSCGVPSVRVPLTLTLRHSRPHTWYTSRSKSSGVSEAAATEDTQHVIRRFILAATEGAGLLGLEGQVDIVALYVSTARFNGDTRCRTKIEYFDAGLLHDFLVHRPTKRDGILQLFAVPTGSKSSCVRVRYVGGRVAAAETRTNVNYITDSRSTVIERGATFDAEEHVARSGHVPSTSALFKALSKQMRDIVGHVTHHLPDAYSVGEATGYFRVHADSQLYFLFMPAVVLVHNATQRSVHPEQTPLSPRVSKPVLAYSGSLPKDYFRCPCCGSVVSSAERGQVPYRMVLSHLENLDAADGTMDGDSPALRAIASTLDKVSRNSQYYSELYIAAAKANPTDNTAGLCVPAASKRRGPGPLAALRPRAVAAACPSARPLPSAEPSIAIC